MKYAVVVILMCLLFSCSNANDLDDSDTHYSHYEPKFSLEEHQELRFFKPFDDSSIIGGPRSFGLCDLTHDSDSLVLMEVTSTSVVVPLCSVDRIEGKYRTSYLTFDVALIEKISGTETPTYFDSIRFLHLGTENFQQGDVVLGSLASTAHNQIKTSDRAHIYHRHISHLHGDDPCCCLCGRTWERHSKSTWEHTRDQ